MVFKEIDGERHEPFEMLTVDVEEANQGAVMRRQMEVQDRVAGSAARKSTQGVRSTQGATAARFASLRATSPSRPPTP